MVFLLFRIPTCGLTLQSLHLSIPLQEYHIRNRFRNIYGGWCHCVVDRVVGSPRFLSRPSSAAPRCRNVRIECQFRPGVHMITDIMNMDDPTREAIYGMVFDVSLFLYFCILYFLLFIEKK